MPEVSIIWSKAGLRLFLVFGTRKTGFGHKNMAGPVKKTDFFPARFGKNCDNRVKTTENDKNRQR